MEKENKRGKKVISNKKYVMAKKDEMPGFYGGGYKLTDEVSSEEIPDLLYSLLNLNYFSASSIEH